jgi:hypothetical protein
MEGIIKIKKELVLSDSQILRRNLVHGTCIFWFLVLVSVAVLISINIAIMGGANGLIRGFLYLR